MKSNGCTALAILMSLVVSVAMMPTRALGQAGGGRGGAGAGGLMQLRQVLGQLDLSADQKKEVQGILRQAMQDSRDAMQGLADAKPEERMAKMQDVQKTMADAKEKIEAKLTPEQKTKYYPLMAKAALKQMVDLLAAVKTAAGKQDIADDLRKQLNDALDDTQKTVDGYKSDADAVSDAESAKDFQEKLTQAQMDLRKQVVEILGQDDAMKLMQSARQGMRPAGAGAGAGFGRGGGVGAGARAKAAPTTAPDAN
jgi:Spy/CpxP family protein refolding chaperone